MRIPVFVACLLLCAALSPAQTDFSQEHAAAVLKVLAVDIGPRPMGSPAEQRAMEFAVGQFREYGCDTSYIMRMAVADGVNTNSGVAIGVKRGKTGRIIVIGGHIDSAGPEVPGANDDGSGSACVIELARVLCKRENESTVLFCCWGGEEQGLQGSKFFVNNFPQIDSVVLMLQIDMADGAGELHADPDGSHASAPQWLVESAFGIFYDDMRVEGLIYPTSGATLNLAAGGATGSDHETFLDKGIPAMDFTSDIGFPIHTPQDSWENFDPSGLRRSGVLVQKLFERYDAGVPSRTTEKYQLFQVGEHVVFLGYAWLWWFIVIASVAGIAALFFLRKKRLTGDLSHEKRWSRFKILSAAFVLQAFAWSSEPLMGIIRGYRFPWVNNFPGFAVLGILSGLIGLWFLLRVLRTYRLTGDPYVFATLTFPPLLVFTGLAAYATPELGIYPAAILLCFSLAAFFRTPAIKLLLFFTACGVISNLIVFDGVNLFQRALSQNQLSEFWQKSLVHGVFILLFTVLSFPFVSGFAMVYRDAGRDFLWLRWFRTRGGLVASVALFVITGLYLLMQPVYGRMWFSNARVEQYYAPRLDSVSLTIKGSEYLAGLSGIIGGRDTLFTGWSNLATLPEGGDHRVSWVDMERSVSHAERLTDSTWSIKNTLTLHSAFRPLRVEATFASDRPFDVQSQWAYGARSRRSPERESGKFKRFVWYAFPDTLLIIPVTFTGAESQVIRQELTVLFDSVASPVRLHREFTNVSYRTIVNMSDSIAFASDSIDTALSDR